MKESALKFYVFEFLELAVLFVLVAISIALALIKVFFMHIVEFFRTLEKKVDKIIKSLRDDFEERGERRK